MAVDIAPNWYPDPTLPGTERYWDGAKWAVFQNLSAGQKAVGKAIAFDPVDGTTGITCEIVDGAVL